MSELKLQYRVPYADTDQMGVVYYANYLIYFERMRTEILRSAGLPYSEMEENGLMLPVIEAHCAYKHPAHYDDLLTFQGHVEKVKGPRIKLCCQVFRDDTLLAEGYTVHASVNLSGKPIKPPLRLRELARK